MSKEKLTNERIEELRNKMEKLEEKNKELFDVNHSLGIERDYHSARADKFTRDCSELQVEVRNLKADLRELTMESDKLTMESDKLTKERDQADEFRNIHAREAQMNLGPLEEHLGIKPTWTRMSGDVARGILEEIQRLKKERDELMEKIDSLEDKRVKDIARVLVRERDACLSHKKDMENLTKERDELSEKLSFTTRKYGECWISSGKRFREYKELVKERDDLKAENERLHMEKR
jgi:chromosome segregation ATPase